MVCSSSEFEKKKISQKRGAEKHGDRSVSDSWCANLCQTLPPGPSLSHQNSKQGIRTHFPGTTTTWGGRLVARSVTLTDGNMRRYREEQGRRWESYSHAERWEPSAEILNPAQFKPDLRFQECRIQLRRDSFWDFSSFRCYITSVSSAGRNVGRPYIEKSFPPADPCWNVEHGDGKATSPAQVLLLARGDEWGIISWKVLII